MAKTRKPRPIADVLREMKAERGNKLYVKDWRERIPPGSRWNPGDPGDPGCKVCEGTGFLRLDVPLGDRRFGRIFYCECTQITAKAEDEESE